MLGWQSYGVTVGAETYQHILSLLKEQAVCRRCQCCYTANSPQVAGNLCLDCFLRREGRQHGLSYVGKAKTHEADPWTTHLYLDPRNRIYTSTAGPGKAEEAQEDAFETLRYWKFPIPEHATINGKTVDVHKGTQSIYGDVTGDIIAIRCTNRHEDTDITFFASKSGMLRQINMRKPAHRKLFAEAKRRLEIQKRTRHFYESEVCETIIEMLCGNPALWP